MQRWRCIRSGINLLLEVVFLDDDSFHTSSQNISLPAGPALQERILLGSAGRKQKDFQICCFFGCGIASVEEGDSGWPFSRGS